MEIYIQDSQIISREFRSTKSFKTKIFYENMESYMKNGDILHFCCIYCRIISLWVCRYSYEHESQMLYEFII